MKKFVFTKERFLSLYNKKGNVKLGLHACNCCKSCKAGKC